MDIVYSGPPPAMLKQMPFNHNRNLEAQIQESEELNGLVHTESMRKLEILNPPIGDR